MVRQSKILVTVFACFAFLLLAETAHGQQRLKDVDVTLAIEAELGYDDSVPADRIDVTTLGGTVTLTGSVDSYKAKVRASEVAQSVKGVTKVRNEIEVDPVDRTDADVRRDVLTALAMDPATEPYEITIRVKDGRVTLEGEANSFTEKKLAEEVVQDVRGVREVENLLTYEIKAERPNHEIDGDVEGRLRANAALNSGLIQVSVSDGNVTLEGSVASALEKSLAALESHAVTGVKSVKNNLKVKWWLFGDSDDWGNAWSDRDMRQAIKNRMLYNPRVKTFNVDVDVEDGIATLTGVVDNLRAKRAAENEATNTLGVWNVKNYLRVRPKTDSPDKQIASSIKLALRRNPYVGRYGISVRVHDGIVYMRGTVDSMFMKEKAEQAASTVPGVVDIRSDIDVDTKVVSKSDREIQDDIESQLAWSPFVDERDITVEVHSGVATVRGKVQDWSEYLSVRENALEGGASSVICDLEIAKGETGS